MCKLKWFDMKTDVDWLSFNDESVKGDYKSTPEECEALRIMVQLFNDEFGGLPVHDKKYLGLFMARPLSEDGTNLALVVCTDNYTRVVKEDDCDIKHYSI